MAALENKKQIKVIENVTLVVQSFVRYLFVVMY